MMRFRVVIAIVWTLVILGLCWLPGILMPGPPGRESNWYIPHIDKYVHAGIFMVFAVLWLLVLRSPRRYLWVAVAGVALAIVSELGQMIPLINRDAEMSDVAADVAGLFLGLLLFARLGFLKRFRSEPKAEGAPV